MYVRGLGLGVRKSNVALRPGVMAEDSLTLDPQKSPRTEFALSVLLHCMYATMVFMRYSITET